MTTSRSEATVEFAVSGGGYPAIRLKPRHDRRIRGGHPWVYSNEIEMDTAAKALPPGSLVRVCTADGAPLAVAMFNPHTLIAARVLARDVGVEIDSTFLETRIRRAIALRERLIGGQYYRLVHAEADGLPGLVVDRFGDTLVVQPNSAGMDRLWPELEAALIESLAPAAIILSGDSGARTQEGLPGRIDVVRGTVEPPIPVEENGCVYFADPFQGQKTGWFYDQRENRATMARLVAGARMLDLYSYTGGFAIACARSGAVEVTAIDRSVPALALAEAAAKANGVDSRCRFERAEAFAALAQLANVGARFDIVIADPPAFAKTKKELGPALKGYRKLATLAARVTAPEGLLFIASCSHHVSPDAFRTEVARGVFNAGREARILSEAGAAPDHPAHPMLPESAYLKALLLALD